MSNMELELKIQNINQEELAKGLELMKSHKEPYCKVMTLWNN